MNKEENYPLRKTVIPRVQEFTISEYEEEDPLSEEEDSPVPNLIHRYPNRCLILSTNFCPGSCRYCTRSRRIFKEHDCNLEEAFNYINEHKEINDIIISGGDCLSLSTDKLEKIIKRLYEMNHIDIIRLGTKIPVILPQRITNDFLKMLDKYWDKLWINIHFTHPDEITPEVRKACLSLAKHGLNLGSQTVLLKSVNDNVATMKELMQKLLQIKVRPYYIYQADLIAGTSHFRTTIEKGKEIMDGLRGWIGGLGVPTFVIDGPGGKGKTPIIPDYTIKYENNIIYMRNYKQENFTYYDH